MFLNVAYVITVITMAALTVYFAFKDQMKTINAELVQQGIDSQGFEYYMEHYASHDLKNTELWPLVEAYREATKKLEDALSDAGVEIDG